MLAPARDDDPPLTVAFIDGEQFTVAGGMAAVERREERFYFVLPLRNVGAGIAVLHSWRLTPHLLHGDPDRSGPRRLSRDLYIPAGDVGFWQGAIREPDDEMRSGLDEAYLARTPLTLDLLYGDHEGGQRALSRFSLMPTEDGTWLPGVTRHWRLDGVNPRD